MQTLPSPQTKTNEKVENLGGERKMGGIEFFAPSNFYN